MAHSFMCPYCNFTTRISDELFTRKVMGRRVKVPCKGCRAPLIVNGATSDLQVMPFRPKSPAEIPRGVSTQSTHARPREHDKPLRDGAFDAPSTRARPLIEEELPTLRQNEIPSDESFLSPAQGSEPPSTSWLKSLPPSKVMDPAAFFAAPARGKVRRGVVAAFLGAGCVLVAGIWFPWPKSVLSTDQVAEAGLAPAVMAAQGETTREQDAPGELGVELEGTPNSPAKAPEPARGAEGHKGEDSPPAQVFGSKLPQGGPSGPDRDQAVSELPSLASVREKAPPASEPQSLALAREKEPPASEPEPASLGDSSPPGPFDRAAAAAALAAAEGQLAGCRAASDPSGVARVTVTFAPSGRVTTATLAGPPFAGSSTGGCIASRFRSARVPPFEGSYVTVTKTVVVQ